MALLAEELVEEWLNREGFFTIRGVKLGVHEMDLLAIRPSPAGLECRHIEVQASLNPASYITKLASEDQQALGRGASSAAKRSPEELERGVNEWFNKKFDLDQKANMLTALAPGPWSKELVIHRLKHPEELDLLRARGVIIHQLDDIVKRLSQKGMKLERASGGDLMDLISLGRD